MTAVLFSFGAAVNSYLATVSRHSTRPSFPRETTELLPLAPPFGFFFGFKSFGFAADFFAPLDLDLDFVAMPIFCLLGRRKSITVSDGIEAIIPSA